MIFLGDKIWLYGFPIYSEEDGGQHYYYDIQTGKSQWDHPLDGYYRQRVEEERERLKAGGASGNATPRQHLSPRQMAQLSQLASRHPDTHGPPADQGVDLSPRMQQQLQMRQSQSMQQNKLLAREQTNQSKSRNQSAGMQAQGGVSQRDYLPD